MNYEKLYKEALERARNLHKDAIDMEEILLAKQCEIIFPELREFDDEKIKRNIIAALKGEGYYDCDLTNECIAWVERQGENPINDTDEYIVEAVKDASILDMVEPKDYKGNFIKEFPSVAEVSRLLGFPTSSITRCCNGSKKYSVVGGYQWKYKGSDKQILNLPTINKYSQDGTLICSYNSVIEASQDTGVHHSSISQCFTGKKKSAGGFIWKKEL